MNWSRWKRRFSGTFRVFVYLAVVNAVAGAFFLRRAQAQAEKAVAKAGAELAQKLGPHFVGPAQAVTVNGQRLFFASSFTGEVSPRGTRSGRAALPRSLRSSLARARRVAGKGQRSGGADRAP